MCTGLGRWGSRRGRGSVFVVGAVAAAAATGCLDNYLSFQINSRKRCSPTACTFSLTVPAPGYNDSWLSVCDAPLRSLLLDSSAWTSQLVGRGLLGAIVHSCCWASAVGSVGGGVVAFSQGVEEVTETMSESVVEPVTGVKFATILTVPDSSDQLTFVGAGVREKKVAFLNVKVYALAMYVEAGVRPLLSNWQGKPVAGLLRDGTFFKAVLDAPVQKVLQIVLVRDITGAQFWGALEEGVQPRLKAAGAGKDGEAALAELGKVFQTRPLKQGTVVTLTWVPPSTLKVAVAANASEQAVTQALINSGPLLSAVFDIYVGNNPISAGAKAAFAAGFAGLL